MNLHLRGKRAWWAAVVLVVAVNAIALGGAAYNRSSEEARLELSERELDIPYRWNRDVDDSSLALRIQWRSPVTPSGEPSNAAFADVEYRLHRASHWLDQEKMIELGFEQVPDDDAGTRWSRGLSREVWVVLEFNGPEHQRALQAAELALQAALAAAEHAPESAELSRAAQAARERLDQEQNKHSRLFAIDAGLDPEALRARYPQRDSHLIARARVSPSTHYYGRNHPNNSARGGYISELSIESVHVPLQFREVFAAASPSRYGQASTVRYAVALAYGRRYEPWIVGARIVSTPASNAAVQSSSGDTQPIKQGESLLQPATGAESS